MLDYGGHERATQLMFPTSLRERWRDGATTLGAWLSLREPLLAEAAGLAGFDYVVIDMQHGVADYADAVAMVRALALETSGRVGSIAAHHPRAL